MPRRGLVSKLMLIAFLVYAAVLVTATHWPGVTIEGPVPRPDLFVHLAAFSTWTVLLGLSGLIGRCPRRLVLWAAVFVVFDETTQPLFERQFDWLDLVANFGGVAIGLFAVTLWWRRPGGDT